MKEELILFGNQLIQDEAFLYALLGALCGLWIILFLLRKKRSAPQKAAKALKLGDQEKKADGQDQWWKALEKSRSRFTSFRSELNLDEFREQVEEACFTSDLGVQGTEEALKQIDWKEIVNENSNSRVHSTKEKLAEIFEQWLEASDTTKNGKIDLNPNVPCVIWFVGVNGVGKTTSIAKLAQELSQNGKSVILAAGDTFRAAASEQLETWAKRLNIQCVRGSEGSDSSAVLFDAIASAKAKDIDYVLCDSAGRLHNQSQLMEALSKNQRVIDKALPGAPHHSFLVLDANTGQNMIRQAEMFMEAVKVTGLILTKMDGSAKGGAIVSVARKTQLPIFRLGIGEKAEDFVPFDSQRFAQALVGLDKEVNS